MTTDKKYENHSDEQLKDLKAQLEASANEAQTKGSRLWGQGFQAGADIYQKNSEDFTNLATEVQTELDKRQKKKEKEGETTEQTRTSAEGTPLSSQDLATPTDPAPKSQTDNDKKSRGF